MNKFEALLKCETLEELKKTYRKLSLVHHPDCGGKNDDMVELNNLFESLFEKLKNNGNWKNKTETVASQFTEVIEKLRNFDIDIEIVGNWLWIGGNTLSCKEVLKELKFKWSPKKKLWYLSDGTKKKSKKSFSYTEIKTIYGFETVSKGSKQALLN